MKNETIVDVKEFGAKGDGVTDYTEAIQRAVNSQSSIVLAPGEYKVSRTIEMRGATVIRGR